MNNENELGLTIVIFVLIVIIIIFTVLMFIKFNINKGIKEYTILSPIKGYSKDLNLCMLGCYRGVCKEDNNKNNDSKYCEYDFQCSECKDRKTGMFYVNLDNSMNIIPIYEEADKLNYTEIKLLNKDIKRNNIIIKNSEDNDD